MRILLCALGLCYALAGTLGEGQFARGILLLKDGHETEAFLKLIRADALFPFSYYTREANAALHGVANTLPPAVLLDAIDRALEDDPMSPNLLWYKIFQELRRGNLPAAESALEKMKRSAKGWPQTENAVRLFEAVRKKINDDTSAATGS